MTKLSSMIAVSILIGSARNAAATSLMQDCSGGTFLVSAVVVTGSALYDIATAPASARRYNERHLTVMPLVDPRRGSYGFSASLSFGRARRPAPRAFTNPSRKSPGTALLLSFATTAGPILIGLKTGDDTGAKLFLGGLILGPSMGHFYAEQVVRGLGTVILRGAGTAVGLYSITGCFVD